ncbi:TIGR03643 family protein [Roseateles sp.]|uniref:TIGR03643 family protein n=1 Tax=Roseateles sp. TaxID=1971397 RepID=UPI00286A07A0|nr:TIGR03643 family protein [Roseateles sp.]
MNTPPTDPLALGAADISRIIEMAWEDRSSFDAIKAQFGLNESAVIALMRRQMLPSSFRMWRKRVAGRRSKHAALSGVKLPRHRAAHTRQ